MARGQISTDDRRAAPDDYIIERDDERRGAPFLTVVVQTVRFALVIVLAAVSLALFWLVGTMLGVF